MKVLPSAFRHVLITLSLVLGLVAALGGAAVAAAPTTSGVALAAATSDLQPTWNGDDRDHRGRHDNDDRDRGRHGDWKNHNWKWKRWVVSPWQCRKGHGHVDWKHGRCWGGRFSGAWIRFW